MSATPLDLFFGWAALLSAAATLGTFATSILFLAVDPAFGRVNDAVSVVQMVLMLPVALETQLPRSRLALGCPDRLLSGDRLGLYLWMMVPSVLSGV